MSFLRFRTNKGDIIVNINSISSLRLEESKNPLWRNDEVPIYDDVYGYSLVVNADKSIVLLRSKNRNLCNFTLEWFLYLIDKADKGRGVFGYSDEEYDWFTNDFKSKYLAERKLLFGDLKYNVETKETINQYNKYRDILINHLDTIDFN